MELFEESKFVIDAGNTRIKIAHFLKEEIKGLYHFSFEEWENEQHSLKLISRYPSILASVLNNIQTKCLIDFFEPDVIMDSKTPVPINLATYTSKTLGVDRIANAVASCKLMSKNSNSEFALSIDIGTCIKFDLVNRTGHYLGGSISPGVLMRYKSLNEFTGALPLLNPTLVKLVGTSTENSIHSGVMNGMIVEINGFIEQYKQQYQHLTIFLTGGDAKMFDKALKSSIFVHENLTIEGLYLILLHNAK